MWAGGGALGGGAAGSFLAEGLGSEVQRGEKWFASHGTAFVLIGRLIPTIRSLVSVPAGLLKMRFRSFLVASTIGTAGWTALLVYAGYRLGEHYGDVNGVMGPIANGVLISLVALYAYRVWTHRAVDPDS